ncbi:MAG: phage terminase large subunit family protein [Gemmatimonadaceae bacterium]|nr:phage terminase large subunit family protein [Gemmatimonadaceae bacterium]
MLGESSAQSGPWQTGRAPYLREILDTVSGREHQDITVVKCSQSGGSEVLLNAIGYYIDQEPSPILVIQPNVKPAAEDFSKDRIAPMVRLSPRLRGKVKDPRARDSGNTILHKVFPGGHLTIVGANSPAGLASRPIRAVLADELDRWTDSAGTEGDPLTLADARQITFRHRAKKVKVSSPGNEGESRIEKEWAASDQRHYYVPCPHCGHEQPLEWKDSEGKPDIRPGRGRYRLVWERTPGEREEDIVHRPETAKYQCRSCEGLIDETQKPAMLAAGRWVKHNPSSARAGFFISGLLSPWLRWAKIAADWLRAKDDDELRKGFFNTKLGLLYVQAGETLDPTKLSSRRESYGAEVPMGVGLLTAGIDVQDDRLEVEVRGWGKDEESWLVRLERILGDPEGADVWERAEALLVKEWTHASGIPMRIRACMVDSGDGEKTDAVYRFVKPRQLRGVYAYKGVAHAKAPISRASKANRDGVKVFSVNPNAFKDVLFARLKRLLPGPGYLHFGPEETGADENYFTQFGAEKRVVEWKANRPVVSYRNPGKKRNEAIDLYVLSLAALRSMGMHVAKGLGAAAEKLAASAPAPDAAAPSPAPATLPRPVAPRRAGGWVGGWKR